MADTHGIQCRQCHELKDELERLRVLVRERNDALVLASNYRMLLANAKKAGFDDVGQAIDAAVERDQLNATLAERLASEQHRFTVRCSELKRQRDSAIAEAKTIIRRCVAAEFRNSRISEDTHTAGIRWLSAHGVEL